MNYLAHLYLANHTSDDPLALVGNLMGDFVKGPLPEHYPDAVLVGLGLHRKIDSYTDSHSRVRAGRELFDPPLRRFAGIILDIGFDHFLSRHWQRFASDSLESFASYCYGSLAQHRDILPPRLQVMLPRMVESDLLASYGSMSRLEQVFGGVSGRVRGGVVIASGAEFIAANYAALDDLFLTFFPDLMEYSTDAYEQVISAGPGTSASRGSG